MPHDDDSLMINSQMRAIYEKAIASLEDGSQFAEYTIVRLLGRGGMGAVYEARHVTLERSYAIKVLPYEFMARRDALERFENEARVMANLEHPNIVRVDDFRQTQGLYWLRMELARGDGSGAVSLQDLADRNGGVIDQMLLLDLMTDVLKGVGYAHEKGVIHRDLKPANILLFPKSGGGLTAKVADYGLVKLLGDEFLRSRVTHSVKMSMGGRVPDDKQGTSTRALLGTWEYMAPEQQQGRDVSPASDVYSLGLIFYKLLTGKNLSLRMPSHHNRELVSEWDRFVSQGLDTEPVDRFADAFTMLDALGPIREAVVLQAADRKKQAAEQARLEEEARKREIAAKEEVRRRELAKQEEARQRELAEQEKRRIEGRIAEERTKARETEDAGQLQPALELLKKIDQVFPGRPDIAGDIQRIEGRIESNRKAQEKKTEEDCRRRELAEQAQRKREKEAKREERYREQVTEARRLEEALKLEDALEIWNLLAVGFPDRQDIKDHVLRLKKLIAQRNAVRKREEDERRRLEEQSRQEKRRQEEIEKQEAVQRQKALKVESGRKEARLLMDIGNFSGARTILEKLNTLDPGNKDVAADFQELAALEERLLRVAGQKRRIIGWSVAVCVFLIGFFWWMIRDNPRPSERQGGTESTEWSGTSPVPTAERRTSNVEPSTSNPEPRTSNPEPRTSNVSLDLGNGITLELVQIPAGSFQMGSPSGEEGRYDDEGPVHTVELDGFWIGKYEVTQAQYQAVMGTNPSHFQGSNRPVEQVSWNDAVEFCRKLSQKTGRTVTLPTEAQWEYACRAGSSGRFCFGDSDSGLGSYAWYSGNAGGETHPVGQKKANAWGLYDMHGNVWEWCLDDWHDNYTGAPSDGSHWGSGAGSLRVHRGGSWIFNARYCRSAIRNGNSPGSRDYFLGFRLAAPL